MYPTGGTAGAGATPAITSCSDTFRFEGVWEGNVLDFYFEPIETVRLVVTPDEGLGGYQATLTFGSGDPPPPVTSGDEPYPNAEFWGDGNTGGAGFGENVAPWPGFAHTVVRGAGCDAVFRVSISSAEPWDEWCALQEPIDSGEYGWGCTVRTSGGGYGDGLCYVGDGQGNVVAEYPLWKCQACGTFGGGGVCACGESGCSFNRTPTHTFDFEGTVDSVISGPDPRCPDCTVRLTRVE
jgi:hypothetical protein